MLFVLTTSLSLVPVVAMAPIAWLISAAVAGACFAAKIYKAKKITPDCINQGLTRFTLEATLLAAVPFAALAFGLLFWRVWETAPPHVNESALLRTLDILCLFQIGPLGWFIWRHCVRVAATTLVSVLVALWTLGVSFTSSMAITGDWL